MADASNANVMASLTQKLTQIMTAPDQINAGAAAKSTFLAFCSPGIALGPNDLAFGNLTTADQINSCQAFSDLVNNIPNPVGFWGMTDKKVWDIYGDAINPQMLTFPDYKISDADQAKLEKAQNFLVQKVTRTDPFTGDTTTAIQDTPQYANYKLYQSAYQDALATYNAGLIQANAPGASSAVVQDWARNGATRKGQVITAWNNWIANGYKNYVEEALGIIANLAGQGPQSMYNTMFANYNIAKLTDTRGNTFFPTTLYPDNPLSAGLSSSWMIYEFNLTDTQTFQSQRTTNSGGSASAGWGLWRGSASASYADQQTYASCDTTNLTVNAQLLQVPLSRAWMQAEVFWSRGWKFSPAVGLGLISDGGAPPAGLMPIVPTAIILAKNVTINLDMTNAANSSSFSKFSTSASMGWGPFSISGNYSRTDSSASSSYTKTGSGITVPGPQIIAFVCELLPKSPNPDPALKWPAAVAAPALAHV